MCWYISKFNGNTRFLTYNNFVKIFCKMSKLETPLPETKEAEIHSNVHITLFLPDTVSVVPDTIPDVLETIPVVPSTNRVVPNSIPVLPNTIPVVQNANPVVSNTNSVADIRTLDQKPSTVICKICHSGGSYEQLIQPCFCKGIIIQICFFLITDN